MPSFIEIDLNLILEVCFTTITSTLTQSPFMARHPGCLIRALPPASTPCPVSWPLMLARCLHNTGGEKKAPCLTCRKYFYPNPNAICKFSQASLRRRRKRGDAAVRQTDPLRRKKIHVNSHFQVRMDVCFTSNKAKLPFNVEGAVCICTLTL